VQCRHERVSRQRGLPVPGIIPKAGIAKAKTAKTAKSAIAGACRSYVFRKVNADAADGAPAFRDKDIPEGKNPHGCGRILPACQLGLWCLYLMLCATV